MGMANPVNRVALLALNAKYVHSSLALWYLAEAVSQFARFEYEIELIESTINQPDSDILERVAAAAPDILGISVYIWSACKLEVLLKNVRICLPNTKIILGGPEASYNAEHWLLQGADYVIQGEGERSFPLLLDTLTAGADEALDRIPGLWRYERGRSAFTQAAEPDTVIDPYTDEYFSALGGRIAYLETSRGCPFKCAFCLSGGSRLRFFPLDAAKEQLLRLSQSGAKTIKLVDRTFNCSADRAYELFDYVISLDTNCCFHFEIAADLFDERTLSLLLTALPGRIQFEAGLQSFNEPTLEAVSRRTSLQKAEQNLRTLLSGRNIHIHIDLIAGLPLETLVEFKQSFNRAYAIGAHTLQLGFLKLLYGSELRINAEQLGIRYNAAPPYEILSSPWISADELVTIKQAEHALQRVYNSGRFLETARYALSVSSISPFELYRRLGEAAPGHGVPLDRYAEQIYSSICGLPGVHPGTLRDHMICDYLCSMRGKNIPPFLKVPGGQARQVVDYAERFLGHRIERCQAAVLWTSKHEGVYVDVNTADPVTGRYKLYRVEM